MKQNAAENTATGDKLEETFLARMKEEQTVVSIWKIWSIYDLGQKYRNIDAYIAMRKDSEIQQGTLSNVDKIKILVEQMLQKEMKKEV